MYYQKNIYDIKSSFPLLYTYETDQTKILLKEQYQNTEFLNIPSQKTKAVDHFFTEALIGNQWVRIDHKIDTGVRTPNQVGIKILEAQDPTYYRFSFYRTTVMISKAKIDLKLL